MWLHRIVFSMRPEVVHTAQGASGAQRVTGCVRKVMACADPGTLVHAARPSCALHASPRSPPLHRAGVHGMYNNATESQPNTSHTNIGLPRAVRRGGSECMVCRTAPHRTALHCTRCMHARTHAHALTVRITVACARSEGADWIDDSQPLVHTQARPSVCDHFDHQRLPPVGRSAPLMKCAAMARGMCGDGAWHATCHRTRVIREAARLVS